jgi:hypothetical protein
MHWSFALNPCSLVILYCVGVLGVLHWSFHGLSLSFSCIEVFMVSNHLYGWVETLCWSSEVFGQPLDALKFRIIQLQGFDLIRCIEIILCWSFRVFGHLLSALKFCFGAPSSLVKCVKASCWGYRVFGCPFGALKFCFQARGFLIMCIEALSCFSALKFKGFLSSVLKFCVKVLGSLF